LSLAPCSFVTIEFKKQIFRVCPRGTLDLSPAIHGREQKGEPRVPAEIAEKVGFDDFYLQNTAVEKFHPHYFVGEILDFGLFQQSLIRFSKGNEFVSSESQANAILL
jgi:hypothetical protein